MSPPLLDLADQVTSLLNTPGAFTPALNASREYQPFFELPERTTAKVLVIGTSDRTVERYDRGAWKHELTVEVLLQKKLATDANADKDIQVTTADAICEYLKTNWPATSDYDLLLASVQAVLQNELFKQARLFVTSVRLTFWQSR